MKLTKKLIPAIAMLVLSAAMVVTSSFAWFSMNTNVEATGMQIKAKADQLYLQIRNKEDAWAATGSQTSVDANNNENGEIVQFKPTAIFGSLIDGETTEYEGGDDFVWVSATSDYTHQGTANDDGYTQVTEGMLSEYALLNTFYLRLNPDAGKEATVNELAVSDVVFAESYSDQLSQTICVIAVADGKSMLFEQEGTDGKFTQTRGDEALTEGGFTTDGNADGFEVKVYVFFNGEHDACITDNVDIEHLKDYKVNIYFTCAA